MTQADLCFKETCEKIINEGVSSQKDGKARTHWEDDGSIANYYSIIGVKNVYDVGKEFPMITYRRNSIIAAIDELLWIWQKKSNNINELRSHVWDQWADENGSIGKAYGYQLSKKYPFKTKDGIVEMDQVDYVLYLLKNDPCSRRIMTNLFFHPELKDMALEPCAYGTQWLVKDGKLHLILLQRSQDMLVANGWNVMQYAALLCMFAQVNGLSVGTLTHFIGDCHIYDRHIDIVKELLKREPCKCCPKLLINPEINNFYDFKTNDFKLMDYEYCEDIKDIPVAV